MTNECLNRDTLVMLELYILTNSIEELYIHIRLIFPVPHPKNVCPFPEGSEVDQTRPLALGSS